MGITLTLTLPYIVSLKCLSVTPRLTCVTSFILILVTYFTLENAALRTERKKLKLLGLFVWERGSLFSLTTFFASFDVHFCDENLAHSLALTTQTHWQIQLTITRLIPKPRQFCWKTDIIFVLINEPSHYDCSIKSSFPQHVRVTPVSLINIHKDSNVGKAHVSRMIWQNLWSLTKSLPILWKY